MHDSKDKAISRLIHTLRDLKYFGLEDDFLCGVYHDIARSILDLVLGNFITPEINLDPYYELFDIGLSDADLLERIYNLKPQE